MLPLQHGARFAFCPPAELYGRVSRSEPRTDAASLAMMYDVCAVCKQQKYVNVISGYTHATIITRAITSSRATDYSGTPGK